MRRHSNSPSLPCGGQLVVFHHFAACSYKYKYIMHMHVLRDLSQSQKGEQCYRLGLCAIE